MECAINSTLNMFILVRYGEQALIDEDELQIAFCWYQPEQWNELKKVVPDPEKQTWTSTD